MDTDVDLRLKGKVLSRVCIDAVLNLEFLEKGSRTVIRISRQMKIENDQVRITLSGDVVSQAKDACVLVGKTVQSAIGVKDGTLDVTFSDGTRLIVPVDPDYEAWDISATDGFMVVSLPGGGLTTWSPRQIKPS